MATNNGWLKLHRSLTNWEWYRDTNTKVVYIHLLINAYIKDTYYMSQVLTSGQYITTITDLARECNITAKQCRTAINHLLQTNNITISTTNKYTIFTIVNYDKFQGQTKGQAKGKQEGTQRANNISYDTQPVKPNTATLNTPQGQTKGKQEGKQRANKRASIDKEVLRNKEIKNNIYNNNSCCCSIYIPDLQDIKDYINNNNYTYDPLYFYNYYKAKNWYIGKKQIQGIDELKAIMDNWQAKEVNQAPQSTQPTQPKGAFNNYNQKIYTADEIEEILKNKKGH